MRTRHSTRASLLSRCFQRSDEEHWDTLRTGAAFWGTEPAGVCAATLRGDRATKCTIFQLQPRRTRPAQHLGASSCCSSTTPASGDPPTATALPAAARSHRGCVLQTAQRQYQCSRRCRTLHKSTPRCAMAAGIERRATFFIRACFASALLPEAHKSVFPVRQAVLRPTGRGCPLGDLHARPRQRVEVVVAPSMAVARHRHRPLPRTAGA